MRALVTRLPRTRKSCGCCSLHATGAAGAASCARVAGWNASTRPMRNEAEARLSAAPRETDETRMGRGSSTSLRDAAARAIFGVARHRGHLRAYLGGDA